MEKMPPYFWTFSFCFVPVIYTPIRIHRYSCSIVLDTNMPVLSLKLPLLHLFQSFHGKDAPIFLDFFVLFRSSDLYTHQNPLLLLFHSAGHRQACIITETPFVTFVPVVPLEKMSPIFWTFSFCFVPVICTPIRIHCYSCSIVLDTDRPVLSLKLPLLHLFRSFHGKDAPIFLDFFVLFRSSDLYTHQNPLLLLFHSAGHKHACIIIETPFVTFVPVVPWKRCPHIFGLFRSVSFQ